MSETVRWNKTDESYPPKKESSSLLDSEDSTDEYEGLSPIAMGLLQAGASMMRNSGWRNTPITMGEAVGNAIPAGLQGYYNQDAMNRQEEQGLYERQQAEQEALAAKQKAEETADLEAQKFADFETLLKQAFPNDRTRQREFRSFYQSNPLEAHKALRKLLEPKGDGKVEYKEGLGPEKKKMGWWAFKGGEKTWLGVSTGDVSKEEEFLFEKFKFGKEFGLEAKKFSLSELAQTNLDEYRQQELTRKTDENAQDYGLRLKQHDHNVIQAMIRNDFTDTQIVNQAEQFRMKYDQENKHFGKGQDLKKLIHNAKMDNWKKTFDEEVKVNGQNYDLASDTLENEIIQDGIANKFTAEKIANQVNQFRERQSLKEKGLKLKQNIFKHQVENDDRNYDKNVEQFYQTLATQKLEHKDLVAHRDAVQDQAIVEHLALIKQRGIENGFDEKEIALKQQEFITKKGQWREEYDLDVLKHRSNVEYKASTLAQELVEYEYKKGRNAKGDIRKDAEWKQHLKEYEDELTQRTFNNFQKIKGHDLKVDIFKADVELKKLKLATEGDQPPRTLVGQAAIDWAGKEGENSPYTPKEGHTPVIKLNKHGQFESIEYLSQAKFTPEQQDFLTRSREKWSTDTEVKAANKITRLVTSLDALAKDGTGVSEFAMIYKFMKSLDETSTVLASEFRNAAGAGLGAFDRLYLLGQKQWSGKQLTEDQQTDIIQAVRSVAYSRLTQMNTKQATYLADAGGKKISNEDAVKMYPNELATYFENNKYTPAIKPEDKLVEKISAATPAGAAMMAGGKYEDYLKQNPEYNTKPQVTE